MIKKLLFTLFLVLLQTVVFAQNTGDFRSAASGNWTTLNSWQYYNGATWVTPSGGQGYPGQIAGTYAVLIQTGHTITMGTADLTTQVMGTVTISGALLLDGGSGSGAGGTFTINTQNIIVTAGLLPTPAKISFTNKVTLNLPTNVSIQVGTDGLPTPGNGTCNNNIEISIGGNVLAYCTGTGSPAAAYTFTDVINNGGYNVVKAVVSKTSLCGSSSFSINGTATPSVGATIKWYTVPNGGTPIYTGVTFSSTVSSATTYYVEASYSGANAYTTSRTAVVVTVDSVPTKTWNGTAWLPSNPSASDKIIFNGGFTSTGDLVACSCQVNSGAVIVQSDHTLTLTNEVMVSGGSLTFENNASLVQSNNNAVNTGNITYKRSNTTTRETDYTYWSSPVYGQTLYDVSQDTPDGTFYSFDAAVDDWVAESSSASMKEGVGYIIRGPDHIVGLPPPGFHEASFIGAPNNGLVNVTIPSSGHETSNLVGNPYPCAVDADSFLTANNAILEGTLYFWTHSTQIGIGVSNPGTGLYAYSSDDYASYNLTGGTGTAGNFIGGVTEQISNKPVGKIAAGQGFFATGKATGGNLIFNNDMRVAGGASGVNNSHFFKTAATKKTSKIQKNRVWLNLTNKQGAFKQALVGYITNATDGYDSGFDGESFDGNEFIDFYSINGDKNLTIQGRALPFDQNDEIPLGYTSNIEGEFSISIDEVDGVLGSQNIYVEDKITGVIKNLNEGVYSFTTKPGAFNDRFVLRYTNIEKILGNGDFDILDKTVLISNKDKQVKINSSAEALDKVEVYDLLGRLVYQKGNVDANELVISNLAINHQVLLVKIELQKGEIITKKISY